MRCAIVQPSYIPWRGYFDIIRRVDLFVFYDDVQYDRRGWRNRNIVKSPHGPLWLTIPVHARNHQIDRTPINAIETDGSAWAARHLETLHHLYSRAPHYAEVRPWLESAYAAPPALLADFTIALTIDIAERLGIRTRFLRSSELAVTGAKTERLLNVLAAAGATRYLSGPSARDYLDEDLFADRGIAVEWMEYDYPEYAQLYPPYDPHVSVLDLLFMTGANAGAYLLRRVDTPETPAYSSPPVPSP
jgi:WbqC-like protein family